MNKIGQGQRGDQPDDQQSLHPLAADEEFVDDQRIHAPEGQGARLVIEPRVAHKPLDVGVRGEQPEEISRSRVHLAEFKNGLQYAGHDQQEPDGAGHGLEHQPPVICLDEAQALARQLHF